MISERGKSNSQFYLFQCYLTQIKTVNLTNVQQTRYSALQQCNNKPGIVGDAII